ncbi:MAG: DNA-directed RNA polymerase subunit beta [Candidatus Dojkabacteria bacterium]|nr:DNA-directed RNA polymerase subunit beta [Candidatus Dojkabacteria bacterium]
MTNRLNLTIDASQKLQMDFLEEQFKAFDRFKAEGFQELLEEINPVTDYSGSVWELEFQDVEWGEPKCSFQEAHRLGITYEAPVYVYVRLLNKKTGEIKKQRIYLADVPIIGPRATFMINGNERVVIFQIIRAEGILFDESASSSPNKRLYSVKLIPNRGNWYELEISKTGVMSTRLLQRRPRILLTTLLRAIGYSSDEEIIRLLGKSDEGGNISFVEATLKKDPSKNTEEALIEIYKRLRPEDTVTLQSAKNLIDSILFNRRKFYLGKVGRYKLNKELGITDVDIRDKKNHILRKEDLVEAIKALIELNHGKRLPHDIDSLSHRKVRGVDELLKEKLRVGFLLLEKNIKDKMSTFSPDQKVTPAMLVNTRSVSAAINQFFGSSVTVRFLDQTNPFTEIDAKRKITAGGPRGLTKERATFSVRDVHNSHYSRFCPVATPEGPNIGLVNQLSIYARINEYGFVEAPYKIVRHNIHLDEDMDDILLNRILLEDVISKNQKIILAKGEYITKDNIASVKQESLKRILKVVSFVVNNQLLYLDPDEEMKYKIASAAIKKDKYGNILDERTYVRDGKYYSKVSVDKIDLVDVLPAQIASLNLALIPFAASDDTNRAMYAAKMLSQAVPLVKPEPPIIGTGFERDVVIATKRCVMAKENGIVIYADASKVKVRYTSGNLNGCEEEFNVEKFVRTNQDTCFSQNVVVRTGQSFSKNDILIESPCSVGGELSLGVNLRTAYLSYEGYNFEDGIVISDRLVKEDILTSIHIQEYVQEIRETRLGPEIITRDIPTVSEYALRNLDENGIVRIGAYVESNDILVGIIAPKGESELTAEEKLLRAIFGEYSRDVRDNSLRMPNGESGVVIGTQILTPDVGAKLNSGVLKIVRVWVATIHKISVGDKLTGLHGEKGVITKIVPEYDMPYLSDGSRVDIIMNPTGMIKRMNTGQLEESHIAELAYKLGVNVQVEPFSQYSIERLLDIAKSKNIDYVEKVDLYDGRTGRKFDQKIAVGYKYYLKLDHLADKKVHARSTGPYTLITQQPLRGKANKGGRRFGEMEVWALEAHATPMILHEMLTIKSDDVVGRAAAYKAIITGNKISSPNIPESFHVLDRELAGLAIKLHKIDAKFDTTSDMALQEIVDSIGEDEFLAQPTQNLEEDMEGFTIE